MNKAPGAAAERSTPEGRAKRSAGVQRARSGWCAPDQRAFSAKMRKDHVGLEERKSIIARQEIEAREREMRRRHENEKRSRY